MAKFPREYGTLAPVPEEIATDIVRRIDYSLAEFVGAALVKYLKASTIANARKVPPVFDLPDDCCPVWVGQGVAIALGKRFSARRAIVQALAREYARRGWAFPHKSEEEELERGRYRSPASESLQDLAGEILSITRDY